MASHSRVFGALCLWTDTDMQKSNACTAKGYYKSANNGERLAESVCIGLFHWNEIEKQKVKGTKNYASRVIKMHDEHRKLQTVHAIMITEEQTHTVHETHFIHWEESDSIIAQSEKCQRSFQLSPELRLRLAAFAPNKSRHQSTSPRCGTSEHHAIVTQLDCPA